MNTTNVITAETKVKTYGQSPLSPIQLNSWLDKECLVIKQNDFDTCRKDYNDKQYDTRKGYNQAYNTYLWEFENC